jgi:hypothetical protein
MNAKKSDTGANALLGDLESIRTLLSEEERAAQAKADPAPAGATPVSGAGAPALDGATAPEDDVPLLDDVVEEAMDVEELVPDPTPHRDQLPDAERAPEASPAAQIEAPEPQFGLDDDMFNRLLGDDWRQAAAGMLDEARSAIEAHSQQWTPQDTDELNEALQVRIDETLHRWLRRAVQDRLDDLKAELLGAIGDQLDATVKQRFDDARSDAGAHGQ